MSTIRRVDKKALRVLTMFDNKNSKIYASASLVILLLAFFQSLSSDNYSITDSKEQTTQWITIFIHGTLGLKSSLSLGLLFNLWRDHLEHTSYVKSVEKLRYQPRLFSEQAIQELGLHPVIKPDQTAYSGPYAFSLMYDRLQRIYNPHENNIYYTYGWSGILSAKRRFQDSLIFYEQLNQEINRLKAIYNNLKIRIVGYSHGGNVALNLAYIQECYHPANSLAIDELILVGTPLQRCTRQLIHSSFFKKIYSIFSCGDKIQRIDVFSPGSLVSRKRFKNRRCLKLPEKLTQARLRVLAPRGYKNCNNKSYCSSMLPCIPFYLQDKSPGHFDLWLFGWNKKYYHQSSPFYPLPAALFIPYIINAIKNYPGSLSTLTILPHYEQALLSVKYKFNNPQCIIKKKKLSFLKKEELDKLRTFALKFNPQTLPSNCQICTSYYRLI